MGDRHTNPEIFHFVPFFYQYIPKFSNGKCFCVFFLKKGFMRVMPQRMIFENIAQLAVVPSRLLSFGSSFSAIINRGGITYVLIT